MTFAGWVGTVALVGAGLAVAAWRLWPRKPREDDDRCCADRE